MDAAIIASVGRSATSIDPIIGRKALLVEHVSSGCAERGRYDEC